VSGEAQQQKGARPWTIDNEVRRAVDRAFVAISRSIPHHSHVNFFDLLPRNSMSSCAVRRTWASGGCKRQESSRPVALISLDFRLVRETKVTDLSRERCITSAVGLPGVCLPSVCRCPTIEAACREARGDVKVV
jgi:hypothetical protein